MSISVGSLRSAQPAKATIKNEARDGQQGVSLRLHGYLPWQSAQRGSDVPVS